MLATHDFLWEYDFAVAPFRHQLPFPIVPFTSQLETFSFSRHSLYFLFLLVTE